MCANLPQGKQAEFSETNGLSGIDRATVQRFGGAELMVLEISMAEKLLTTAAGWKLSTLLHCLKNYEVDLDGILIEFTFSFHLLFMSSYCNL